MLARLARDALLGLVDALVPAVVAASLVHGVTLYAPGHASSLVPGVVGGVVLFAGFVAGALSARHGGEPFPVTRATLRVWKRLWWV